MGKDSIRKCIFDEVDSFLHQVSISSENLFLILFTAYIASFYMIRVFWIIELDNWMKYIRVGMLSLIMWGSALYLLYVIVEWKKLWKNIGWLLIISVPVLVATAWFSNKMTTNAYNAVMDFFFCIMVCGKSYKKVLSCVMGVAVSTLLIAGLGQLFHFTLDAVKPENVSPGHSFGIIYPNTWGYIAFVILIICWYLYFRRKPIITFGVFWIVTAIMYFVVSCRTIALLTAVFPLIAFAVDLLESRTKNTFHKAKKIKIGSIVEAFPILYAVLMLGMFTQYNLIHKLYNTPLNTFAMRFVQGALFLKTYGVKLIGNAFHNNNEINYVLVDGEYIKLGILDNSIASYLLMRGVLWVVACLVWQVIAIRKALKNHDYGIPFLCIIILMYAAMERPGLDVWFNFILLYPLAKVVNNFKTEAVTEPEIAIIEAEGTDLGG